jgi:preprotein translocase subunit SecY
MLSAFKNSFKIPELRRRIMFTVGLIVLCRFVAIIPTPGIDIPLLNRAVGEFSRKMAQGSTGGFAPFIDLFSGCALFKCAVGALGIMPYISASIILQLMTAIVPSLERLAREGDVGRQKLTQYTRYLTLLLCCVQGFGVAKLAENAGAAMGLPLGAGESIVLNPDGLSFELMAILCMTTGTMIMMWLGEQITERGIGNGISIIITVNIISRMPMAVMAAWSHYSNMGGEAVFHLIGMVAMIFLVIAGTVALTQGQRKVPIHTTKRVVGRKVYGGQSTYMPLRINYSGVMPIIFASVMLQFPGALLSRCGVEWLETVGRALTRGPVYTTVYAAMILFFSYFWVATQFNPLQIADDLKKNGGYVPGIRPGRPTAEFLDKTMTRITLVGALSLTLIAVFPQLASSLFGIPYMVGSFFGGTSLLIMVGVALDTMRQIESHLLMRHYDGFLRKGRIRGKR